MKKLWIVLGVLLSIVVVGVVVAAMNLEAWLDDNRGLIEAQASDAIGREVRIRDLGVQLFGGFGVRVDGLRVAEDATYGEGTLLTLEQGVVRVSILPALFGSIEIGEVVLAQPDIRVIRDDRGLSIDSLMAADPAAEDTSAQGEGAGLDLTVSELRIEDGRVVFEDRTGDEPVHATIEHVDVAVDDIGPERPLHFDLKASLLGAEAPNLAGEGTAGPVLGAGDAPLEFDVRFELEALSLDALAKLEDVAAALPEDTGLTGGLDAEVTARGVPEDVAFDAKFDMTRADVSLGSDLVKPPGIPLTFLAAGRARTDHVVVERFAVTLADAMLEGTAKAALDEAGAWEANIRGKEVPLGGWGALVPAAAGLPVEGWLGMDVRARGDAVSEQLPLLDGTIAVDDVAVRLDDTPPVERLTASLRLKGSKAALRETRFDLGGAAVQLEADVADMNAPEVRFALDSAVLPLAALGVIAPGTEADDQLRRLRVVGRADLAAEELVADARLASPEGRIQGIDYTALEGRARVDGTQMHLDALTMKMLGGGVALSGLLDQSNESKPRFAGEVELDGLRVEEVTRARFPGAKKVASGRVDTRLSLSGAGLDSDTILQSLTGAGSFAIRDGMLHDINLAEEVLRGATGVPGLSSWISPSVQRRHPELFSSGDTRFRTLGADVEIEEGKLRTDDLDLETGDFALTGGGTIGLDGRVAMQTEFKTSAALATSLVGVASPTKYLLDRSGRLVIPVRIDGQVTDLRVRPDDKYLGDAIARAALGSAADAIGGLLGTRSKGSSSSDPDAGAGSKAKDEAPGADSEVQRGLEGLFGR